MSFSPTAVSALNRYVVTGHSKSSDTVQKIQIIFLQCHSMTP